MSPVVFAIAAIPAAVVVVVAATTRSRPKTALASIIGCLLGALTGSPTYAALDVGLVVLATYLAWPLPDPAATQRKVAAEAERQAYLNSPEHQIKIVRRKFMALTVGIAVFAGYLLYLRLAPPA